MATSDNPAVHLRSLTPNRMTTIAPRRQLPPTAMFADSRPNGAAVDEAGRRRGEIARRTADAEVMAGLVSACRYCGLLDASLAAHARGRQLDAKLKTSVAHTWFMQGDYDRTASISLAEFPYIGSLSLAELRRGDEALPVLRELEVKTETRLRNFIVAARTLLDVSRGVKIALVSR